jgi:hypothetical protein
MSEPTREEKIRRAVLALGAVKRYLVNNKRNYSGICPAIAHVGYVWLGIEDVLDRILLKINNDIHDARRKGYLFPLNEGGKIKRLAYLDDILANIHEYL